MTGFLNLPLEIRQIIYDFSLVTAKVIRPHVSLFEVETGLEVSKELKNELAMGLLSVNRLIREEARIVFYGSNVWYLSARFRYYESEDWSLHHFSPLWTANIQLFRRILINFDMREAHTKDTLAVAKHNYSTFNYHHVEQKENYTQHYHHDDIQILTMIAWARKLDLLHSMSLSSLDILVNDCYCPATCCRLVVPLLLDPAFLKQWHRVRQKHKLYEEEIPITSAMVLTKYDRNNWLAEPDEVDRERHSRIASPVYCDDMKIKITGLAGRTEFKIAHALGFGCHRCPMKHRVYDTACCEWESDEALWKVNKHTDRA